MRLNVLQATLKLQVLQVEDGTWRIVARGRYSDSDAMSMPFANREEAMAAIDSLKVTEANERSME